MERNRGGRPRHPDVLTPAEWRVLEALREGGTNAEIGTRLGISANAVKYHIANMLGKLDLPNRRALAAWRPEERRGRLPAWFAVPAALAYVARPLVWIGLGTAAAAGVTVTVLAAVVAVAVVLVVVGGDGEPPAIAPPSVATPEATSTPAPTVTTPEAAPTPAPTLAVTTGALTATKTPTPIPEPTLPPTTVPTETRTPIPEPSPAAIATPAPSPTSDASLNPAPTAAPAPEPTPSVPLGDFVRPAPGAMEHRTFVSGERIDWSEGIFLMDPQTGQIEGYRLADWEERADVRWSRLEDVWPRYAVSGPENRWLTARGSGPGVLLDRRSGSIWRLPDHVEVLAASEQRLLMRDAGRPGVDLITDIQFREIASVRQLSSPHFSPGGGHLLFSREGVVFVMDLETFTERVLFEGEAHGEWGVPDRVWHTPSRAGQEILVGVEYGRVEGAERSAAPREWRRFSWDGERISTIASPTSWSPHAPFWHTYAPDGQHIAWQEGGYDIGFYEAVEAWPSVVVADAATGEPLFRVRSASLQHRDDNADWLASGDGLVLRTAPETCGQAASVLLRIRPEPAVDRLPGAPTGCPGWPFREGTIVSATDTDRYFAEVQGWDERGRTVAVYDAGHDRWHSAVLRHGNAYGDYDYLSPSWGTFGQELRLTFAGGWAAGGGLYLFAQPSIEFPPFDDTFAFQVARTTNCLRLRSAPSDESSVLDCLPNGTRVVLSEPGPNDDPVVDFYRGEAYSWFAIRVRTQDGREGWVAHDNLDHAEP